MDKFDTLLNTIGSQRLKFNENLKYFSINQMEKTAQAFYIATTVRELINILNLSLELKIPYTIYGNGSKLLNRQKIIKGLVVRNRASSIKIVGIKGKVGRGSVGIDEAKIEIDSGVTLIQLNEFLDKQGLQNPEWSSSMKGTVGGSLLSDRTMQEKVEKIKIWDKGHIDEILPTQIKNSYIFLSVVMKLKAK